MSDTDGKTKKLRTSRYRVYPTDEQVARIEAWQDPLRLLWNLGNQQYLFSQERCRYGRKWPHPFEQANQLTELRAEHERLRDVPYDLAARVFVELNLSWQRCWAGLAEQPRFKSKNRGDWTVMCEPNPKVFRAEDDAIVFPKLGRIEAVVHRPLLGKPKTCTITRDIDEWYVSIACEVVRDPDALPPPVPVGAPVGIDRGVVNLLMDSNARPTANARYDDQTRVQVARAQRSAAKKKKGGKNRKKANKVVSRLRRKARRQRDAVLHRESLHYAKNHSVVVIEKLNLPNMTRSASGTVEEPGTNVAQKRGLNRSILGAGLGKFGTYLKYKAKDHGSTVVEVPAAYTSQTCSSCGHVAAESRKTQSEFECVACGYCLHADVNAAKVILSRGTHGGAVCGGSGALGRPKKQKLRVVRRGSRSVSGKAPDFRPG